MKIITALLIVIAALLSPCLSHAEQLRLSSAEVANLGIKLGKPSHADSVGAVSARAQVVVPPSNEIIAGSSFAGRLVRLHVNVGDTVSTGQVLAEVQSPDYLGLQREYLDALFKHNVTTTALNRDRQLFEEGIVSARRLQESESNSRTANAQLNEHHQLLLLGGMQAADIKRLSDQQRLHDKALIRSPMPGVVTQRLATIGQQLNAMAPILHIVDLSTLWLEVQVAQQDLASVTPGMRVTMDKDSTVRATVETIARSVDRVTQTATLRATVSQGAEHLLPGQLIAVTLGSAGHDVDLFSVPLQAIMRSGALTYVFVRTDFGFEARSLKLSGASRDRVFVSQGIDADTQLAVAGVAALKSLWASQQDAN
jgi:cobalt-zinc-cadmium efflux system membrane fusion protein